MKPKLGNLYTKNNITIQIDSVDEDTVYFAKYRAKIGDVGSWDNFLGYFRLPINDFKKQVKL